MTDNSNQKLMFGVLAVIILAAAVIAVIFVAAGSRTSIDAASFVEISDPKDELLKQQLLDMQQASKALEDQIVAEIEKMYAPVEEKEEEPEEEQQEDTIDLGLFGDEFEGLTIENCEYMINAADDEVDDAKNEEKRRRT